MKTLANATDKEEILRRLRAIWPASQRRWGKMSVAEMICHSSDALKAAMGDLPTKDVSNLFSRYGMKWAALLMPTRWPHGIQTVPECDPQRDGTRPVKMENDLRKLEELLERFTQVPRGYGFQAHPMFGEMTDSEWMRWGYLHMDHHLRQFGA